MKLWGGRFTKETADLVEQFTASIQFDVKLMHVDILGSMAHVKALEKAKLLNSAEAESLLNGLKKLCAKIEAGTVVFSQSDEDIHMNIERLLTEEIGDIAGKLHTGRSRNDQVALDMHLYLRMQLLEIISKILHLQQALCEKAKNNIDTIMPGYTHLQRAQPVRFAHHLLTYVSMLQRDVQRLMDSWPRINTMPLGAGALAGAGFNLDREYVAELLGFDHLYENSMDAVSDRDFVVEFLSHAALIIMHLSRLSEELILWSSREFDFIELDDAYCTGSSMMPQKKNPDVAELVRGKTGRIYGALMASLTLLKGLPLTYNRDMQEDKEGLFDTLETLHNALDLYAPMIATMKIKHNNMLNAVSNDFSNATELADYLVKQGISFRESHAVVGKIVLFCIQQKILLNDVPLQKYQEFSPLIKQDIYLFLEPENVVNARNVRGGTAKDQVEKQLKLLAINLSQTKNWLNQKTKDREQKIEDGSEESLLIRKTE